MKKIWSQGRCKEIQAAIVGDKLSYFASWYHVRIKMSHIGTKVGHTVSQY